MLVKDETQTVTATKHFQDQIETYFFHELSVPQAMATINSKMRHRKRGEHWVLLKRLGYDMFCSRRDTADQHINGDVLIAVVRYDDQRGWVATTAFVRRERQTKKCNYYWA